MRKVLLGGCLLVLVGLPRVAFGLWGLGDIVNDPLNLVQNSATALRSWMSNANEVLQIENQVRELAQDAQHLVQLPFTVVEEINAAMGAYNQLLNQARGISYSVQSSIDGFEQLYSNPTGNPVQWAQRMLGQVRQASQTATQSQAIFDQLCAQQAHLGKLLAFSKASVGSLQAQQVNNELTGVLIEQQAALMQLQAAAGRVEVAHYMRQAVAEEQAAKNAQTYLRLEQPGAWDSRPLRGRALPE